MTQDRFTVRDQAFMQRALTLASRGLGRVEPNPMVGCVLVKGSRIVSEGFHRLWGGAHAEVNALRGCPSQSARDATAYVTLEPCAHFGKTAPCSEALIGAGIKRVIAAMKDPAPEVSGRGLRRLRAAGIEVRVGCLGAHARRLNAAYCTLVEESRPYVLLKWAQSLDGQLCGPANQPRTISGPAAHRWVHRLRARVDGIVIGIETALSDNPRLTARGVPIRRLATRIVLDGRLRLGPGSNLARTAGQVPTLVLTSRPALKADRSRVEKLRACNVQIEPCRMRKKRVDLADALGMLGARGMTNVLVEGGATVINEFLAQRVADEAFVFVAPRVIGGPPSKVDWSSAGSTSKLIATKRIGPDTLYHLHLRPASGGV